eukprot:6423715-Amphidinium_carterae.1
MRSYTTHEAAFRTMQKSTSRTTSARCTKVRSQKRLRDTRAQPWTTNAYTGHGQYMAQGSSHDWLALIQKGTAVRSVGNCMANYTHSMLDFLSRFCKN